MNRLNLDEEKEEHQEEEEEEAKLNNHRAIRPWEG